MLPFSGGITGERCRNNSMPLPHTLILRLDITGRPSRWIPWQEAVVLDAKDMISWNAGETYFTFRGGTNRISGRRSLARINSIIAVSGRHKIRLESELTPLLSNRELFRRDGHLCMYCGRRFADKDLTRDHLVPLSRGGKDSWSNVVAACQSCNHAKGATTPEQAHMPLLAVPYVPNRAEYLVLSNRQILADQMAFLQRRFRSGSPLHQRH